MISFFNEKLNIVEIILISAGFLFFASIIYMAFGGDLSVNYFAKAVYIFGTILLIYKI